MYLSVCLSICLSACLSIYLSSSLASQLSTRLSVCLSVYLCLYLSLSVSLTIYLFLYPCMCLSVISSHSLVLSLSLSFHLSLSLYLSLSISANLSVNVCLSLYRPISLSLSLHFHVHLYLYLCLCLFLSIYPFIYPCTALSSLKRRILRHVPISELVNIKNKAILLDLLTRFCNLTTSKTKQVCETSSLFLTWQRQKRSNSASLPPKFGGDNIKTKQFYETSFTTRKCSAKLTASCQWVLCFLLHLPQVLRLPHKSEVRSYEVLHLSPKIILADLKIWCSKMQLLSGNQRPDLLTSLMEMSLVLRLPRDMHLCRSSSNVPPLPAFLKLLQNPDFLLTLGKVQNPLRLPRKMTVQRPKVVRTCDVFTKCFAPQLRVACNFWFLIRPDGSAPAALASLLFDPPSHNTLENQSASMCFATFLLFCTSWSSFYWPVLFWLFLFSDCSPHCCCL